jgi:DNA-binding CsgD family transcriptional regulator/PAS domain-containing protein
VHGGVLEVVDRAYQAAVEPALWPAALECVADLLGAERSIIIDYRRSRRKGLESAGFEPESLTLYFEGFQAINPIQAAVYDAYSTRRGPAEVTTDQSWVDKPSFTGSAFYNDYFRRFDMHAALLVPLGPPGESPTLNLIRSRRSGEFEAGELEMARTLRGPLSQAYRLGERVKAERRTREGMAQAIDLMTGAVVVTDGEGRILHANPAAAVLLAARDGMLSRPEGLRASGVEEGRRLARLIAGAASNGAPEAGGALSVARPSGLRPLSVLVGPLPGEPGRPRLALVSITDPEQSIAVRHERLRELYGLTTAEGRAVAELVAGHEPRVIAERLEISLNTVRVQLARAMAKTGAQRQSELVSLVMRTLGGWA